MSSLPQAIRPNINVNAQGQPKYLPEESEIAGSGFESMCAILEVVAARLHHEVGGTVAGTTTVALISEISRLFLTNQSNKKFDGITAELICGWIDELFALDYEKFLTSLKLRHVYELSAPEVQQLHKKSDSESKKTIEVINFVYYNLYPSFVRLKAIKQVAPLTFEALKSRITSIFVITNDQLMPKGTVSSGLHGEGRFVRFCYIHYVKDLTLLERIELAPPARVIIPSPRKVFSSILQPVKQKRDRKAGSDEEDSGSGDESHSEVSRGTREERELLTERYLACLGKLKKDTQIETMQILVASSQGTCVDCQGMLSRLKIAHNTHRYSKESPSPNWVDPFTWQDIHSQSLPDQRLSATSMGQRFGEREAESIMAKRRAKKSVKGGEEGDE